MLKKNFQGVRLLSLVLAILSLSSCNISNGVSESNDVQKILNSKSNNDLHKSNKNSSKEENYINEKDTNKDKVSIGQKESITYINAQALDNILWDTERNFNIYIEELDSGNIYTQGYPYALYPSLGNVFIPILIAVDKNLDWEEKVKYGDSVISIENLVREMMDKSNSTAANKLMDLLGGKPEAFEVINNELKDIGCKDTEVNRYLDDTSSEKENYTHQQDMAIMLKHILNLENKRALDILISGNEKYDAIKNTVNKYDDFVAGSKYGIAPKGYRGIGENIYNNAGIIMSKDGQRKYVMSIASSGENDNLGEPVQVIENIIKNIIEGSEILVNPDLNGDGDNDIVKFDSESRILSVNDQKIETDAYFFEELRIVDINENDNKKEILLIDAGPSYDYTGSFYEYDGEKLNLVDVVYGHKVKVDGKGNISTKYSKSNFLCTWYHENDYVLTDDYKINHVPRDLYHMNIKVKVKSPITLQQSRMDERKIISLEKGEEVVIVASDDKKWILVENSQGEKGWFSIKDNTLDTIEGTELKAIDVFEGLPFFD